MSNLVTFKWYDMLIGIGSILLYFVDIGTDINLAYDYLKKEMLVFGLVTLGFIVVPSLVICGVGLLFYVGDYLDERKGMEEDKTSNHLWFWRFLFTVLQLGIVIRTVDYLYHGVQSRNKKLTELQRNRHSNFLLETDLFRCHLRLLEGFMEAAPQLTFQLYVFMVLKPQDDVVQASLRYASSLSSLASVAVSLVSIMKSKKIAKKIGKMSIASMLFCFLWRVSEVGCRVLCISMYMSVKNVSVYVAVPLGFHYIIVLVSDLKLSKKVNGKIECEAIFFHVLIGFVKVFCFLNLRLESTATGCCTFYILLYTGNFTMLGLWFYFTPDKWTWFHICFFVMVFVFFVCHFLFQFIYYAFFHLTVSLRPKVEPLTDINA